MNPLIAQCRQRIQFHAKINLRHAIANYKLARLSPHFNSSSQQQIRSLSTNMGQDNLADTNAPIAQLEVQEHFEKLNKNEKLYSHHMSRASYWGLRAVLRSVSYESEDIYDMIIALYNKVNGDWSKLDGIVSDQDKQYFLEYASQFLSNAGNYKSFGDSKFVPRLEKAEFEKIAKLDSKAAALFDTVKEPLYSTAPEEMNLLGYPDQGHMSSYYSSNVTKDEIEKVQKVLEKNDIMVENTRLFKNDDGFVLTIASAQTKPNGEFKNEYDVDGTKLKLEYGDHANEFKHIVEELTEAKKYTANEHQSKMLTHYINSFNSGSMNEHVESQREWVKDLGPSVETNIGYIETYRDPKGVRGEWEGLVAMVNKEQTVKFQELVDSAGKYIPQLPWSKEFEKDKFEPPAFLALEVMTFANSGIPAGINLPNYDKIRMNDGFKNVSLSNVLNAKSKQEKVTFLTEEDVQLYEKYRGPAFEVQVGIHELLGHGSGKLLSENQDGSFNFDVKNPPTSPITHSPVNTYYKKGQTWGSVFGSIAGSYEECRAESVAMYLSTNRDLLQIFGHTGQEAEDVLYVGYLQMARAGLLALEFWDPKSNKWGQAHMQARYAILQCFIKAGFARLESSASDYSDLVVKLDRQKIDNVGKQAMGEFLQHLHIYKASADFESGSKFYNNATTVGPDMAKYREAVLAAKLPRKQFVQCNTSLKQDGSDVKFLKYEPTVEGMIQSFAERGV